MMPDATSVQAWFDARGLPCTIDDCLCFETNTVLSGTVLGQRCYGDAHLMDTESGKDLFPILYPDYYLDRDTVFTTVGTNILIDRVFVFLIATAIASLSGGALVDAEDSTDYGMDSMLRACHSFIFKSRILLSFLANGSVSDFHSVDSDAIPLLPNETESSRRWLISHLIDDKHIYTSDENPKCHRLTRYKLTSSGLVLAKSMYRNHDQGVASKHWKLILAKES